MWNPIGHTGSIELTTTATLLNNSQHHFDLDKFDERFFFMASRFGLSEKDSQTINTNNCIEMIHFFNSIYSAITFFINLSQVGVIIGVFESHNVVLLSL